MSESVGGTALFCSPLLSFFSSFFFCRCCLQSLMCKEDIGIASKSIHLPIYASNLMQVDKPETEMQESGRA